MLVSLPRVVLVLFTALLVQGGPLRARAGSASGVGAVDSSTGGSSSDLTSGSSSSGSSVPNTPVDTPSGHVDGSSGHAQKKKFRNLCLDESTTSAAFVTCMTKHRPNPTSDKIARWTEYFNEKHKPKSIQRRTGGQVVGNDHHYTPAY